MFPEHVSGQEWPTTGMRDGIVILLIALASLGVGFRFLRRRSANDPPRSAADPHGEVAGEAVESRPRVPLAAATPVTVPNITVPPHPEDRLLATLVFDGPPGQVPVRRGELVIGRHSSDDVRIADVRVSRHHARLVARDDGGFEIHNLTSVRPEPNPMQINGADREHAEIAEGDVVTLGGVSFQFRLAAA